MRLVDGEERLNADRYTQGTDYIQFWRGTQQVGFFRTKDVERIDEVGGQGAELLAEVRAEGPESDAADEYEPDADAS